MSDSLTPDEEAFALERIVRNQIAIRELEEENARLKLFFKDRPELYPVGTNLTRGKFFIRVEPNTRIDQKLAEKELQPLELRRVSKSVIDPTKARALLTPEQVTKITKVYDNRLVIGLTD